MTSLIRRLALTGLLMPAVLSGQEASALATGHRLQITRALEAEGGATSLFVVHGRYAGFQRNHVVITQRSSTDTLRIPFDQVARVDVAQGRRHPFLHDVLVGAIATAAFGTTLGAIGAFPNKNEDDPKHLVRLGLQQGAIAGASLGLIAAAIGRSGWVPFDRDRLRNP